MTGKCHICICFSSVRYAQSFIMICRYPHIRAFWSGAAANTVVVEADAFKETDVIYRAISSRGHHDDMLQTAELVFLSLLFFV